MTKTTRTFIAGVQTVLSTQMPNSDDSHPKRVADDHSSTNTRDSIADSGKPFIDARAAETPDSDHCVLLPRIGSEIIGVSLLSMLNTGESDGSSPRAVPQQQHYESLRALRRTDEFQRVRRYLGRRQQSVSLKPRSATILQGETGAGDSLEIAVAGVDIRGGSYDEAFVILGRTGDGELIAAGIEYVETATRQLPENGESETGSARQDTIVCVSMKAVDALGELEEEQIAIDAKQPAQQPAD